MTFADPDLARTDLATPQWAPRPWLVPLTPRELAISRAVAAGRTDQGGRSQLVVSVKTARPLHSLGEVVSGGESSRRTVAASTRAGGLRRSITRKQDEGTERGTIRRQQALPATAACPFHPAARTGRRTVVRRSRARRNTSTV